MLTFDSHLLLTLLKAFWLAFLPAAAIAAPTLALLIRLKSRQTVSQYAPEGHQKKQGTPTMGGLIVVFGTLFAATSLAALNELPRFAEYITLFLGFAAIGFVDDYLVPRLIQGKRGLGWRQKILMQTVVAVGALLVGGGFNGWEAVAQVFLILFFSNAYNFADGLDGLAGGLGVLLLSGLISIALISGYTYSGPAFACCLIGSLIPFMILNSPPAKLFMGDVGSLPIGAAVGLIVADLAFPMVRLGAFDPASEWYMGRPFQSYRFAGVLFVPAVAIALVIISLVMAAELIPVPLQIASVKLRKKRLFTMTPIHHGFEAKGWPESRVVWRFILVQLLLTSFAITVVLVPAIRPIRADPVMRTAANR